MSQRDSLPRPSGTAYMEIEVSGRWALSLLTENWTDDECQALLDGDDEAKEELEAALFARVMSSPDAADAVHFDLRVDNAAS